MTDRPHPSEPDGVEPDVELASALLDGEATADERARADDPAVQAQLEALRAVSARVGEIPPAPPELLDRHLAAALDAFDDDGTVVALEHRRGTGRTWWQRAPLGAVAAVLVVVALIGAVGLASLSSDDGDDTATAAFDEPGDSDDMAATAEDGAATLEAAPGAGAAGSPRAVYADVDELADDLAAQLGRDEQAPRADALAPADAEDAEDTTTTADDADVRARAIDPCDAVAVLGIDRTDVIDVVAAVVDGLDVTALIHGDPDQPRLSVVDDASCELVDERDL